MSVIGLYRMRPLPSSVSYPDRIRVYAPGGYDDENSPDDSATPAVAAEMAASVQVPATTVVTREQDGPTPFGVTRYEIRVAVPPGDALAALLAVVANTRVDWVGNGTGDFATPVALAADGPARMPCGLGAEIGLSATHRA